MTNLHCELCRDKGDRLAESQNFYLRLDDAPIVEGHALICAKNHYRSLLDLPDNALMEFAEFLLRVRTIFLNVYSFFQVCENGRISSSVTRVASSEACFHAHVHVIPYQVNLYAKVERVLNVKYQFHFHDLMQAASRVKDPYLLISDSSEYLYIFPVTLPLPNKFIRYCLSEAVGSPERWNWNGLFDTDYSLNLVNCAQNKLNRFMLKEH